MNNTTLQILIGVGFPVILIWLAICLITKEWKLPSLIVISATILALIIVALTTYMGKLFPV